MRPLLAPTSNSDNSDSSSSSSSLLSPELYIPLQAADWDALEAICAILDEPGGPQTFNSLDYTHACKTLQIGPSSVWFATYQIVAEYKLGKPVNWTSALREVRLQRMRLDRVKTSQNRFQKDQRAHYFRKWRHISSQENVLMAKCYAFEVNTILMPAFESWRVSAQALHIYNEDMETSVQTLQLKTTLDAMGAATAKVHTYKVQSQKLQRKFNRGFGALQNQYNRLAIQLGKYQSRTRALWFRKWLAKTVYSCQQQHTKKQQLTTSFGVLRQRAQEQAQNNTIAVDLDRYNTLAPCFETLLRSSKQLASARSRSSGAAKSREFLKWNEITHLNLASTKFRSKSQARVAANTFRIWRETAPLQAKSRQVYAESTAKRALMIWKLHLKCTLLCDSWQYQQVQRIIKYWYLKCSAEVYTQYHQLETRQHIFDHWKSVGLSRYDTNTHVLSRDYDPYWAANGFEKMRARVEMTRIDAARAESLDEKFTMRRGFDALKWVVDRDAQQEEMALGLYSRNTEKQVMAKWKASYETRRDTILSEKATRLYLKQQCDLKSIYLRDWCRLVDTLEYREKDALRVSKKRYFALWNSRLAEYNQCENEANEIYKSHCKRVFFGLARAVQDQIEDLNVDSQVFGEIRTLQLQQTLMRRMQMRMVRYRALESEAARFSERKKYDSVKFVLRHWYSKAINPHVEPLTPRSARRLPPSALRKIVLESRPSSASSGRPSTLRPSSSPASDTPTRTNRRLFRPSS